MKEVNNNDLEFVIELLVDLLKAPVSVDKFKFIEAKKLVLDNSEFKLLINFFRKYSDPEEWESTQSEIYDSVYDYPELVDILYDD